MPALLRGPKDPDAFRVTVNRTRWYRDPLPADSKWPVMADAVPAVSTIKKAWSKPFKKKTPTGLTVPLDAYRAADYVRENLRELAAMHPDEVFGLVATAPDRDLKKAADRGTAVHSVIEALALGQRLAPELHDDAVRPFIPACEQFVDEWQPQWRMTEFVVINRTLGFAGTADSLAELPGDCPTCGEPFGLVVIDYKSRGGKHGAYEEEVCQLGGYATGEYVVVTNAAGDLERIEPPDVKHGAIVSITADDGYRLYPVEIADARHAFLGLFETWRIKKDGTRVARQAVGLPAAAPHRPDDEAQGDTGSGDGQDRQQRPTVVASPTAEQQSESVRDDDAGSHRSASTTFDADLAHTRSRVVAIVAAAAGRPLPVLWPHATPTFKPGSAPITAEHLPAIDRWCEDVEREWRLLFPPPSPAELAADDAARAAQTPDPTPAEPRRDRRAEAEQWAARGRALLDLLHDEPLARACAQTAGCDEALMSRENYLALQAVVSQMSEPTGVLTAYWSGSGVELRAVNDMEKALLAQMPVEGVITKRTKLDALQRGKRIAKRLGVHVPKTYDDLCGDLLLAACVAVGHGVNPETSE